MKKLKPVLFLMLIYMLFIMMTMQAAAEERNIYVGDLIELKISTLQFSEDELREKFKDFEIVDMKEEADGYLITLRTFETGEKKVQLGDKEIIINVKSTLDELKRDNIFEGDSKPAEAGFYIEGLYVLIALLVILLSAGLLYFRKYIKRTKVTFLTPYKQFINQIENTDLDDNIFFAKLTAGFKEYLEATCLCSIRGKTTSEIMDIIGDLPNLSGCLPDIRHWLSESDHFKYTGSIASSERKTDMYEKLIELVRMIEVSKDSEDSKEVAS